MNQCTYPYQYIEVRQNVLVRNSTFSNIQGRALFIEDVWGDTEVNNVHFKDLDRGAEISSKWKSLLTPC